MRRLASYLNILWVIARSRGVGRIFRYLASSGLTPAGFKRTLLWAADIYAYECRTDAAAFRRWLTSLLLESGSVPELVCSEVTLLRLADADGRDDLVQSGTEFVVLVHPGATASQEALAKLMHRAKETSADFAYGDEYLAGSEGPESPFFKPGFSVDLLRAEDYIGPVLLARRSSLLRCLDQSYHGKKPTSVYGVMLRAAELSMVIVHAPGVWVAWDSRRQRNLTAEQIDLRNVHLARCNPPKKRTRTETPEASIIIPTRDRAELLRACLDSVYRTASSGSFEVIVVDNGSVETRACELLDEAPTRYNGLRVLRVDEAFNWSRLNNLAREVARGRVGVFLNNDIEATSMGWLSRLTIGAERHDIGAVGALLLYPDGCVQHAGVVVGIGGLADHVYSGVPGLEDDRHVFVDPFRTRNVLACTGACLAIEFDKLDRVGGFDEGLALCGDIELCVRLYKAGYLNLYDSAVRLLHHESATRPKAALSSKEVDRLWVTVGEFVRDGDPFYNPQLDLRGRYPTFLVDGMIA